MKYTKATEGIEVFKLFRSSLKKVFEEDWSLFSTEHYRKEAVSSRLAMALESEIEEPWLKADISVKGSDIILWDRNKEVLLGLFWAKDYIGRETKEKARAFHIENNPVLTLAFSIIPSRPYLLVYRFEKLFLDYIHVSYDEEEGELLKRVLLEDDEAVENSLFSRERKSRKRDTSPNS